MQYKTLGWSKKLEAWPKLIDIRWLTSKTCLLLHPWSRAVGHILWIHHNSTSRWARKL